MQADQEKRFVNDAAYRLVLLGKLPHRAVCVLACEFADRVLSHFDSDESSSDPIEVIVAAHKALNAAFSWALDPTEENRSMALAAATYVDAVIRSSSEPEGMLDAAQSAHYAAIIAARGAEDSDRLAEQAVGRATAFAASAVGTDGAAARIAALLKWLLAAYQGAVNQYDWEFDWAIRAVFARGEWSNDAWSSASVMGLAQSIFFERAFDRMPILADALEEAGCDDIRLLAHLRDPASAFTRADYALLGPLIYTEVARKPNEEKPKAVRLNDYPAYDPSLYVDSEQLIIKLTWRVFCCLWIAFITICIVAWCFKVAT